MWKTANEIFERSHQDEEGRSGKKRSRTRGKLSTGRRRTSVGKRNRASTVCIGRKEASKGSRIGQKLHLSGSAYPFGNETRGKRVHNKSKIKIGNRGKDRVSVFFFLCGETDCCVTREANNSR